MSQGPEMEGCQKFLVHHPCNTAFQNADLLILLRSYSSFASGQHTYGYTRFLDAAQYLITLVSPNEKERATKVGSLLREL